tara:strand:- start:225 stop:632 length:408 start_codon:yes stop_codon:yes gene_type:complete
MDKKTLMRTFNNHFIEMLDDIIIVYPNVPELRTSKTFAEHLIKYNPRKLITLWSQVVTQNYREPIMNKDESFFMHRDVDKEAKNIPHEFKNNYNKINSCLKLLQETICDASDQTKKFTFKYLQNLIKLSDLYFNN